MLHFLPIDSLLEFGLIAEAAELNLLALEVISIYYAGQDQQTIQAFTELVPDAALFIVTNFIRPYVIAVSAELRNSAQEYNYSACKANADEVSEQLTFLQAVGLSFANMQPRQGSQDQDVCPDHLRLKGKNLVKRILINSAQALSNIFAFQGQATQSMCLTLAKLLADMVSILENSQQLGLTDLGQLQHEVMFATANLLTECSREKLIEVLATSEEGMQICCQLVRQLTAALKGNYDS